MSYEFNTQKRNHCAVLAGIAIVFIAIQAFAGDSSGVTSLDALTGVETPVEEVNCLVCDATQDGEYTAQDAVDCFWLSLSAEWSAFELCVCDYNEDGEITAQDAVNCFMFFFWRPFPVE